MRWSGVCFGVWRGGWAGRIRLVVVAGLVCVCVVGFSGIAVAAGERCPNAVLRVGPSAGLPDCRAYELVTPADLGRTEDMTFTKQEHAIPSSDGERIALETVAPLEPDPSASANVKGTNAVFSRTPTGWEMMSATAPGTAVDRLNMRLFSPDLSQVALVSYTALNEDEESEDALLEVGPVGGPYALVASVPNDGGTEFLGANAGVVGVPAFSHVLFVSKDHELLLSGAGRVAAEGAVKGVHNLYDWTGGELRLVNVTSKGTLLNPCGAVLGAGSLAATAGATNAVSEDGSKIFFTSPEGGELGGAACEEEQEPPRLYMRVDGTETVEVSEPEGVTLAASERYPVNYNVATPDGSEVFFSTETPLTGKTVKEEEMLLKGEKDLPDKLFEYDTEEPEGKRLTLIARGVADPDGNAGNVVVSEDGSTVYYEIEAGADVYDIYRYETGTGQTSFVATAKRPNVGAAEHLYTTGNGEFLLFPAKGKETGGLTEEEGVNGEPRGARHNELYRYDHFGGSVMCVSCGEGDAPTKGEMVVPHFKEPVLQTEDETPPLIPMSEDGQEVFFQTSAQLMPQDTNVSSPEEEKEAGGGSLGQDVYEWEAEGAGGCSLSQGCTRLLSSGEDVGPAVFLGASRDGSNVFFTTAAQLVPQATPEFTNIYDARVDGGFPSSPPPVECLSCQGVGSPPPLFNVPASGSFAGTGTSVASIPIQPQKTEEKGKKKGKRKGKKKKKRQQRQKRGPGVLRKRRPGVAGVRSTQPEDEKRKKRKPRGKGDDDDGDDEDDVRKRWRVGIGCANTGEGR